MLPPPVMQHSAVLLPTMLPMAQKCVRKIALLRRQTVSWLQTPRKRLTSVAAVVAASRVAVAATVAVAVSRVAAVGAAAASRVAAAATVAAVAASRVAAAANLAVAAANHVAAVATLAAAADVCFLNFHFYSNFFSEY